MIVVGVVGRLQRGCGWWVTAWVMVVGLMGHGVGCECDRLLFAGLMFCGFACSISEKREERDEGEERERDRDDDE